MESSCQRPTIWQPQPVSPNWRPASEELPPETHQGGATTSQPALESCRRRPVIGEPQLVSPHWRPATGGLLPKTHNWRGTISQPALESYHQGPATRSQKCVLWAVSSHPSIHNFYNINSLIYDCTSRTKIHINI